MEEGNEEVRTSRKKDRREAGHQGRRTGGRQDNEKNILVLKTNGFSCFYSIRSTVRRKITDFVC